MAYRVFIGVGHGGKDPGAVANGLKESEVNLGVALAMKNYLEKQGVIVGISRIIEEDDPLTEEIKEANAFKPDVAVEVHHNAGGGKGFEVYHSTGAYKEASLALAKEIEADVKKIGQTSRGCKVKLAGGTDYFGWVRQVKCPAVLCEGAFLDSDDYKKVDTKAEQREFGIAYGKAVLRYLKENAPADKPVSPTLPNSKDLYVVQVFAGNEANAKAYAAKIGKLKIDGKPIQTIVKKM